MPRIVRGDRLKTVEEGPLKKRILFGGKKDPPHPVLLWSQDTHPDAIEAARFKPLDKADAARVRPGHLNSEQATSPFLPTFLFC